MADDTKITRREFVGTMAAASTALLPISKSNPEGTFADRFPSGTEPVSTGAPDFAAVRADFPRAARKLWLAASETHPFNINTLRALENYTQYRTLGPGEGRKSFTREMQDEVKQRFAGIINAKQEEIAFCLSTTDGENIVVAGLDLQKRGGNVVIDDLHFEASEYMYSTLAQKGHIELRVVRHRDWKVEMADVEKAIDKDTRLVSMALVSNVNGYMHEVKAISDLAHAHGALIYGDIIQGAGCTPIDVQAMGIDCAASSTYKWLMGDFGLGFLYVREDLQGTVIKQTRYGLRQIRMGSGSFDPRPGAARYEGTTTMGYLPGICAYEGLKYVTKLGVEHIRTHAKRLTDRLQKELPPIGYPSITPLDCPTPIVSFLTPDSEATRNKLNKAFGERVVSQRKWHKTNEQGETETVSGMRIGISVYNNDDDIDQFLNALS
ncbi:MAG: aminotransferase class V-fold PLP-dependent enzyme [Gemmatimonadota bacterium]|nr:aminotransferase class V-fold PLP-dependent enzyme [Gemmatimonadota bacterium]